MPGDSDRLFLIMVAASLCSFLMGFCKHPRIRRKKNVRCGWDACRGEDYVRVQYETHREATARMAAKCRPHREKLVICENRCSLTDIA